MEACDRCQEPLPNGALRFDVRLRLCGETGGLPDPSTLPPDAVAAAVTAADAFSEQELLEGVIEEFRFVLCPRCRELLRADPAGARSVPPARGGLPQ